MLRNTRLVYNSLGRLRTPHVRSFRTMSGLQKEENTWGQGKSHATGDSVVPEALQKAVPKGVEEALPEAVHPTNPASGKATDKTNPKDTQGVPNPAKDHVGAARE